MRVCRRGRSDRDVMSGRSADGGDVVIVCCGTSGDSVFSTGGIGDVPGVSMSAVSDLTFRLRGLSSPWRCVGVRCGVRNIAGVDGGR